MISHPQPISSATHPEDVVAFFDQVYEVFLAAADAAGETTEAEYIIAGHTIRLRFAGSAWPPVVTPALAHLLSSDVGSQPFFTFCLWDSVSTGTKMPPPPWSPTAYVRRGEIHGFNTERIHTAFDVLMGIFSIVDVERRLALCWVQDIRQLRANERAVPLRTLFHWSLRTVGLQLVHGGAVGLPQGAVLLAGAGGAGKSNTALSCLRSPLHYIGDDFCLLSPALEPTVFSLYNTGRLHRQDIERLPHLAPFIANPDGPPSEKALFFLAQHFPEKMLSRAPLRAILLPRVMQHSYTTWQVAPASAAFRALAEVSLQQLPGADHRTIESIARITRSVPCYYLGLGSDREQLPQVILEFLSSLDR
jgi:hypothetical protein